MDLRRADLHMHTRCSDGRLSPEELVLQARSAGLHAIAVTDHDCVDGLDAAVSEGARLGLDVIPGIELSVTVGLREAHLLGYMFDPTNPDLSRHLKKYRDVREQRVRAMLDRLRGQGIAVSMDTVLEIADGGILGRPHVAAALVQTGAAVDEQDAFERFLKEGASAYVAKPPFAAEDALAMLHRAGGIGVLAHPGHWTSDAAIKYLVKYGLDGVETVHPSHDYGLQQYYKRMAHDLGLIETGGSDYHGFRESDQSNLGRYSISYVQLDGLRRRAA